MSRKRQPRQPKRATTCNQTGCSNHTTGSNTTCDTCLAAINAGASAAATGAFIVINN